MQRCLFKQFLFTLFISFNLLAGESHFQVYPFAKFNRVSELNDQYLDSIYHLKVPNIKLNNLGDMDSPLFVEIPPDTQSFHIFIVGKRSSFYYWVTYLENPKGEVLVQEEDPAPRKEINEVLKNADAPISMDFSSAANSLNKSTATMPGVGSLLVPNHPSVKVIPGLWKMKISNSNDLEQVPWQENEVDLFITLKRKTEKSSPNFIAEIKLNLYFTGAKGLSKNNALEDFTFKQSLKSLQEFYAKYSIKISFNNYFDLHPYYHKAYLGPDSDKKSSPSIQDVFSQGKKGDAINIILIDEIDFRDSSLVALSGSLPGPTVIGSTLASGIAIAWQDDPIINAHIMAHEIGHYLGLYHTNDSHLDTGNLENNLMNPEVSKKTKDLNPDQLKVILGHPLVRLVNRP